MKINKINVLVVCLLFLIYGSISYCVNTKNLMQNYVELIQKVEELEEYKKSEEEKSLEVKDKKNDVAQQAKGIVGSYKKIGKKKIQKDLIDITIASTKKEISSILKTKKITENNLAKTEGQMLKVDVQIKENDGKIDKLECPIKEMELRLAKLDSEIQKLDGKIIKITSNIKNVEKAIKLKVPLNQKQSSKASQESKLKKYEEKILVLNRQLNGQEDTWVHVAYECKIRLWGFSWFELQQNGISLLDNGRYFLGGDIYEGDKKYYNKVHYHDRSSIYGGSVRMRVVL